MSNTVKKKYITVPICRSCNTEIEKTPGMYCITCKSKVNTELNNYCSVCNKDLQPDEMRHSNKYVCSNCGWKRPEEVINANISIDTIETAKINFSPDRRLGAFD